MGILAKYGNLLVNLIMFKTTNEPPSRRCSGEFPNLVAMKLVAIHCAEGLRV